MWSVGLGIGRLERHGPGTLEQADEGSEGHQMAGTWRRGLSRIWGVCGGFWRLEAYITGRRAVEGSRKGLGEV